MAIDFQHSERLTLSQPAEDSLSQQREMGRRQSLHPRLACIIEETLNVRRTNEYMRQQAPGNQREVLCLTPIILIIRHMIHILLLLQPCDNCAGKPEAEQCVRTWKVKERKDVDSLLGSIITCAEAGDVLTSKVCICDGFQVFCLTFSSIASFS
jgi:hypothetical protein